MQHLGVREDAAEDVVHVVREPGRERADRVHALRVHELIAQSFAIGLGATALVELVGELARGRLDIEPMGLGVDQRAAQADLHDHRDEPDAASARADRPASRPASSESGKPTASTGTVDAIA